MPDPQPGLTKTAMSLLGLGGSSEIKFYVETKSFYLMVQRLSPEGSAKGRPDHAGKFAWKVRDKRFKDVFNGQRDTAVEAINEAAAQVAQIQKEAKK